MLSLLFEGVTSIGNDGALTSMSAPSGSNQVLPPASVTGHTPLVGNYEQERTAMLIVPFVLYYVARSIPEFGNMEKRYADPSDSQFRVPHNSSPHT